MIFESYPLIIYKEENRPLPILKDIVDGLLNNGEIPIRIISNSNDEQFQFIKNLLPKDIKILHIIVVIKYPKIFES